MSEGGSTDFLRGLRVFSLPAAVRWLMLALIVALGGINTTLFALGILEQGREDWVKASLELMAVILPFLVLALVVVFSSSVTGQTRRRTIAFLVDEVPDALTTIVERRASFESWSGRVSRSHFRRNGMAKVDLKHSPGSCIADYAISVPDTAIAEGFAASLLLMRLELNVRRLTVCIGISRQHMPAAVQSNAGLRLEWFQSEFPATLAGARHCGASTANGVADMQAGYHFNRSESDRIDARDVIWFVATRDLKSDFLWDATERVYILQDMIFMTRAFLRESPRLFSAALPQAAN